MRLENFYNKHGKKLNKITAILFFVSAFLFALVLIATK